MTVGQLINQLKAFPEETEVWLSDELGEPSIQLVHDDVHLQDDKVLIETY